MRRSIVVASVVLMLLSAAVAQRTPKPFTEEGLRTAQEPRRYEPPPANATAEQLEESGDQYRTEKAYADAIDYYRAALAKTQDKTAKAALHNKIGIAELQLSHVHEALKNFQRAVKYDSTLAEAHNNVGAAFYIEKKYGKAIGRYKKALKLRDQDAAFHNNLATAYFARKEMELATAEYLRALQLDPEVFERNSRTGVAAKLSTPEDRAEYNYMLAKMYARTGNFDRSLRCLKRSMEEGFKGIKNVYKDQEFTGLRKDPRFESLMAGNPQPLPE